MGITRVADLLDEAENWEYAYSLSGSPLDWAQAALAWFRYDRAYAQYRWEVAHGQVYYEH